MLVSIPTCFIFFSFHLFISFSSPQNIALLLSNTNPNPGKIEDDRCSSDADWCSGDADLPPLMCSGIDRR
ncbi:hypothetical protein ACJW30_08G136800 [Castanea mollissima]